MPSSSSRTGRCSPPVARRARGAGRPPRPPEHPAGPRRRPPRPAARPPSRSAAGRSASRCWATRSCAPGCSASSRAAPRWPSCALRAGEVCVDPAAHDRVDERQRPARLDDPGRGEQLGCLGRLGLVQSASRAAWRSSLSSRIASARASRRQARAAGGGGGERSGRPVALRCARRRARRPPSGRSLPRQRVHEPAQQERAAAGRAETGVDEGGSGSAAERRLDELGDGGSASAGRAGSLGARIAASVASSSVSVRPPAAGSPRRARRPAPRGA